MYYVYVSLTLPKDVIGVTHVHVDSLDILNIVCLFVSFFVINRFLLILRRCTQPGGWGLNCYSPFQFLVKRFYVSTPDMLDNIKRSGCALYTTLNAQCAARGRGLRWDFAWQACLIRAIMNRTHILSAYYAMISSYQSTVKCSSKDLALFSNMTLSLCLTYSIILSFTTVDRSGWLLSWCACVAVAEAKLASQYRIWSNRPTTRPYEAKPQTKPECVFPLDGTTRLYKTAHCKIFSFLHLTYQRVDWQWCFAMGGVLFINV